MCCIPLVNSRTIGGSTLPCTEPGSTQHLDDLSGDERHAQFSVGDRLLGNFEAFTGRYFICTRVFKANKRKFVCSFCLMAFLGCAGCNRTCPLHRCLQCSRCCFQNLFNGHTSATFPPACVSAPDAL